MNLQLKISNPQKNSEFETDNSLRPTLYQNLHNSQLLTQGLEPTSKNPIRRDLGLGVAISIHISEMKTFCPY